MKPAQSDSQISRWIQAAVPIIAAGFLLLGFGAFFITEPGIWQLHFNFYGLLSTISFLTSLIAWIVIQRVVERTESHMWFSLFLLSLVVWAAAESLMRYSVTPTGANFWAPFTTLGSVLMPISLYMFAFSYTNPQRARQPVTLALLVITSCLFITVDSRTNYFTVYDPATLLATPWGFTPQTNQGYIIITLWVAGLAILALALLISFRRRVIDPIIRRQVTSFIVAILIPTVGGGITDGILPSLNLHFLPPMTVMLVTIMGIIITSGIIKYQFFSITPDLVAAQILDTMNEAVVGVGPDLQIRFANDGAVRLLGYSAAQLSRLQVGQLFVDKLSPAETQARLFDALAGQPLVTIDKVNLKVADGSTVTAKLSITAVGNNANDNAYIVVVTDITALATAAALVEQQVASQTRTIRETKAQLDSSINSLELGLLIFNRRPEVVMANQPAHALFCGDTSHAPQDCRQVRLKRISEVAGPKIADKLQLVLQHGHTQRLDLLEFNNHSWRVVITPVTTGRTVSGAALVIQDITEQQILDRSRDEFFSIASHELRTPLTAIKGGTSMILQYYAEAVKEPSLHEIVDDIHESSERLIAIVNDFLDVSRLEQGRITYNLAQFDLAETVEGVAHEMAATIAARGIYLHLSDNLKAPGELPQVYADQNRVKQILFNLVGNAAKFTEVGGITVAAKVEGRFMRISVSDTGHGISKDMQPLLFHKFQQASESIFTREAAGGTGLGLYISRLLASGMGGKLVFEHSEVGKGTVFSFTLPLAGKAKAR